MASTKRSRNNDTDEIEPRANKQGKSRIASDNIQEFCLAFQATLSKPIVPTPRDATMTFLLGPDSDVEDWFRIKTFEEAQKYFTSLPGSGFYLLGHLIDQLGTNYAKTTSGDHTDDDFKALFRVVVFQDHNISTHIFQHYTTIAKVPGSPGVKRWMEVWKPKGQSLELFWLEAKILQFIGSTGGWLAYLSISPDAREQIFGAVFDGAPTYICKTLWARMWSMVGYPAIIHGNNDTAKQWLPFVRRCFTFLCEETFKWKCILNTTETDHYLNASWREMTWYDLEFCLMRATLGDVNKVPILADRFWRDKSDGDPYTTDGALHLNNPV